VYKDNTGLLLWGNIGTGKTFFAACIANALINNGVPVLMTNFAKIINALSGFNIEDKNKYIVDFNRYKLLVIDDLGAERQSDFAQEIVYNVIDSRYKNGQPIIITTNLTLDEIKKPANITYSRIYDRILPRSRSPALPCSPKHDNSMFSTSQIAFNLSNVIKIKSFLDFLRQPCYNYIAQLVA
jgi:DNA replication protein DnaC